MGSEIWGAATESWEFHFELSKVGKGGTKKSKFLRNFHIEEVGSVAGRSKFEAVESCSTDTNDRKTASLLYS